MPFSRTTNPPSLNPFVTVEFAGLLLLKPGTSNTCNIGIHHLSLTHLFQVILIVNKPDRPPLLVRVLTGQLLSDTLVIAPDPAPPHGDFMAFAPTPEPFIPGPPFPPPGSNRFKDYRWSVNMRDLNPRADFDAGALPMAILSTGVLFTADLSRDGFDPKYRRGGLSESRYFISATLAAAIERSGSPKVKLSWKETGDSTPKELALPRRFDPPNTTYIVSLINEPPISTLPEHNEFDLYYQVLTVDGHRIDPGEQWILDHAPDQKTDEIPCMPIILEP